MVEVNPVAVLKTKVASVVAALPNVIVVEVRLKPAVSIITSTPSLTTMPTALGFPGSAPKRTSASAVNVAVSPPAAPGAEAPDQLSASDQSRSSPVPAVQLAVAALAVCGATNAVESSNPVNKIFLCKNHYLFLLNIC
jgi:hypothetical protein